MDARQTRWWTDVAALLSMRNLVVTLEPPDRMAGVLVTSAVRAGRLPPEDRRAELIAVALAHGWRD